MTALARSLLPLIACALISAASSTVRPTIGSWQSKWAPHLASRLLSRRRSCPRRDGVR